MFKMIKSRSFLLFIFALFLAITNKEANAFESKWQEFAFTQVLAVTHGGVAALEPQITGVIETSAPFFISLNVGFPEKKVWPLFIGYLGLGIYNLSVNENDTSDGEIFLTNYLGMNLVFLSSKLLTEEKIDRPVQNSNSFNSFFYFKKNSAILKVAYSF